MLPFAIPSRVFWFCQDGVTTFFSVDLPYNWKILRHNTIIQYRKSPKYRKEKVVCLGTSLRAWGTYRGEFPGSSTASHVSQTMRWRSLRSRTNTHRKTWSLKKSLFSSDKGQERVTWWQKTFLAIFTLTKPNINEKTILFKLGWFNRDKKNWSSIPPSHHPWKQMACSFLLWMLSVKLSRELISHPSSGKSMWQWPASHSGESWWGCERPLIPTAAGAGSALIVLCSMFYMTMIVSVGSLREQYNNDVVSEQNCNF